MFCEMVHYIIQRDTIIKRKPPSFNSVFGDILLNSFYLGGGNSASGEQQCKQSCI